MRVHTIWIVAATLLVVIGLAVSQQEPPRSPHGLTTASLDGLGDALAGVAAMVIGAVMLIVYTVWYVVAGRRRPSPRSAPIDEPAPPPAIAPGRVKGWH